MKASVGVVELYKKFKDQVEFVHVYVREAHPQEGWSIPTYNQASDPKTLAQRRTLARRAQQELQFGFTTVVDEMDDRVATAYAAWPERLYAVDKQGRIVYAGGQGPFEFWPTDATRPKIKGFDAPKSEPNQSLEAFLTDYLKDKRRWKAPNQGR